MVYFVRTLCKISLMLQDRHRFHMFLKLLNFSKLSNENKMLKLSTIQRTYAGMCLTHSFILI